MILKVQRSIEPNKAWSEVLIYSKDRKVFWQGPMTNEIRKLFKANHEYRIFCKGFLIEDKIHLQERVKHQKW